MCLIWCSIWQPIWCSKFGVVKFVEFFLTMITSGLHYPSFVKEDAIPFDPITVIITCGTYFGFVLIMLGVFIGLYEGVPINSKMVIFFTVAGIFCYIASAGLSYSHYTDITSVYEQMGMAKVVLSVINALAFFMDAIFLMCDP